MFKVDLTCFSASEGLHTSYSECCVWVDHCLQFCLLLLNIHPRVPGGCVHKTLWDLHYSSKGLGVRKI